jgi:hypothetical protein
MSDYEVKIEIPPLENGACSFDCHLRWFGRCRNGWNNFQDWQNEKVEYVSPDSPDCPRYKDLKDD